MRVVLDTNTFISAVIFTGPTSALLELWQKRKIRVLLSAEILEEYLRVLAYPKFKLTKNEIRPIINQELLPFVITIKPKARIKVATDPDDNKFIEAAISGKAKFVISGDRALIGVKRVRKRLHFRAWWPRKALFSYYRGWNRGGP